MQYEPARSLNFTGLLYLMYGGCLQCKPPQVGTPGAARTHNLRFRIFSCCRAEKKIILIFSKEAV